MELGDTSRKQQPAGSSDRTFGLFMGTVFLVYALAPLLRHHPVRLWAIAPAIIFAALALAVPGLLSPLNRLWTRLGLLLHRLFNPVVLAVLFFVILTPISIMARLTKRKTLVNGWEPDAKSYWIRRDSGDASASQSMSNQF